MASFNKLIDHNKHMSILLFGVMAVLFAFFGASLGAYWGGDWLTGVIIAVAVAGLYFFISWRFGASIILASSGAKEISHEEVPQLWNTVEELSIAGGMPMPKVYLIEDEAMNAFATGRDPQHAAVAITRGLLDKLNREELQGVMAHEMSHVRNYDIRFSMLMAVMVGSIVLLADVVRRSIFYSSLGGRRRSRDSRGGGQAQAVLAIVAVILSIVAPLLASLIQLAVSRQREYLADASAVELTRNPAGLISALKKLTADTTELKGASQGMQHLYIVNPLLKKKKGKDSLFSTHPALSSRIERLEGLMGASA
jgi:heat shock protein HtpX